MRPGSRLVTLAVLLVCSALASAQDDQHQKLDRQFQSAVADYHSGKFAEAASQLEMLLPYAPKSFEIHELLGLAYAAQSKDGKAIEHFQIAVQLKPDSAAAHTNLAASLSHLGKTEQAGEQFRKALALEPHDYDANHNLGEYYIQTGKLADAAPYLEEAQRINPGSYDNGFDLATAYLLTGKPDSARHVVESLLKQKDTGELHSLLGQIDEKDGKYLDAVNEFQAAAHMDPSEDNLFHWGSELLLHRTYEPAIEVFQKGTELYRSRPACSLALAWPFIHGENMTTLLRLCSQRPTSTPPTRVVITFSPRPTTVRPRMQTNKSRDFGVSRSFSPVTGEPATTTR